MPAVNTAHSNHFQAEYTGVFVLDYQDTETDPACRHHALYQLAQARAWNPEQDLTWQIAACLQDFPTLASAEPLRGFKPFEQLAEHEQRKVCWQRHTMEVSELLHGEQGALLLAAQLVAMMPTTAGKLLASAQVNDEARHIRFFQHYLSAIEKTAYPPSPSLQQVITRALSTPDWSIKCCYCQILIESLALARFRELRESTRVPLLRQGLGLILKDEARHARFGADTLRHWHRNLSTEERHARADTILENAYLLSNSNLACQQIALAMNWDSNALRRHLREFHIRHPQLAERRMRQLKLNIKGAGLILSESS
jgi:hypothetical protein